MAQALPRSLALGTGHPVPVSGRLAWRAASWMSLLALVAGLICLMYLVTTSSLVGTSYDIQRLERERNDWRARNEQLQYELAKLHSLTWVEAEAVNRLGMIKPKEIVYLRVDPPSGPQSRP